MHPENSLTDQKGLGLLWSLMTWMLGSFDGPVWAAVGPSQRMKIPPPPGADQGSDTRRPLSSGLDLIPRFVTVTRFDCKLRRGSARTFA